MRKGKILDQDIKLNKKEYNILIKRFDLRRAKKTVDGGGNVWYCIETPCICGIYDYGCKECPLNIILEENTGCGNILTEILGKYLTPNFHDDNIEWTVEDDEEARKNIRKIRKALKSMKEVK